VDGNESDVAAEKDKIFLVPFANAIVYPWTIIKLSVKISFYQLFHLPMTLEKKRKKISKVIKIVQLS
jgi:hypothetical protein